MEVIEFNRLTFRDDFVFCRVLIENPGLCKRIAEIATGRKIKSIVRAQDQKSIREAPDGRGVRFDVLFEDEEDIVYDIEMQQSDEKNLPKRTRYYQSLADLETLRKGRSFNEIKNVYIIFICTFDPFHKEQYRYTAKTTVRECPEILFDDGIEKIFLNAEYRSTVERIPSEVKEFLDYVRVGLVSNDLSRQLDDAVKSILNNDERRVEYMELYEKFQQFESKGRAEGRAEGRAKGRAEMVDTIMKNSGKDLAYACALSGMSEEEYYEAKRLQ